MQRAGEGRRRNRRREEGRGGGIVGWKGQACELGMGLEQLAGVG